jgi:hypothetical protein
MFINVGGRRIDSDSKKEGYLRRGVLVPLR